jgi:hypothetical protein
MDLSRGLGDVYKRQALGLVGFLGAKCRHKKTERKNLGPGG